MFNQNLKMYNQNIEYLNNVIDVAESYIKDKEYIGIFGVSIAGIWLSEIIINYIEIQEGQELFFAYGDIDILNRKIGVIDLPIYNLENIPKQATVFCHFRNLHLIGLKGNIRTDMIILNLLIFLDFKSLYVNRQCKSGNNGHVSFENRQHVIRG